MANFHLGAGVLEPEWCGDEEDELATSDRRREGGGVEEVGVEQPQPLRRAGDQPPQQPCLLLVSCSHQQTNIRIKQPHTDEQEPIHTRFAFRRVSP